MGIKLNEVIENATKTAEQIARDAQGTTSNTQSSTLSNNPVGATENT